ncbi:uncharacterized protein IUM83_03723 [Phytophthora cinnamomi]|uniref:uncharacterized protein n=1 Tax=Phytophthora cinnamomi TaxID=4785 RepID=UPI003559E42F|nr:hypothetical protein IUM83_03723 [Phytophthora cinnamomi]
MGNGLSRLGRVTSAETTGGTNAEMTDVEFAEMTDVEIAEMIGEIIDDRAEMMTGTADLQRLRYWRMIRTKWRTGNAWLGMISRLTAAKTVIIATRTWRTTRKKST